jgi:ABC-type transport system involved in multi-copper enzyme maturation permease subunit
LVGVGAVGALIVLGLLYVIALIASRVPGWHGITANSQSARQAALAIGALAFVALSAWAYWGLYTGSDQPGGIDRRDAPMMALLIVIASLLVGFAAVYLTSRRSVDEMSDAVREGPLGPILAFTLGLAAFGVVGFFLATTPMEILRSLSRLPSAGTRELSFTIPAASTADLDDPSKDPPQHPIQVYFPRAELRQLKIHSTQTVTVDVKPSQELDLSPLFKISSNEEFNWMKSKTQASPFEEEVVTTLYVRNYGTQDAALSMTVTTAPPHPQVATIPITALSIAAVVLLYLLQRAALPKLSAVSLATLKSELAQPLFMIVIVGGIVALVMFIFLPYNTLGEDIKVLKDSGMTLIMVMGIIQAIWAASTSISDEIDGRTALTVLSKPIGRRSFIIGKFLGIFWTVAVIFVILGVVFMVVVAYKPIFDAKENSQVEEEVANWQVCHFEMVGVIPGLILAFLETVVLAALSVAVSTRLPMLANFIVCFSIYVLGHLTPLIVQSSVGRFAPVQFVAELSSAILPILDHFNITTAVATGVSVPYHYLGWALVYSLLYGAIALLLALLLFEDRDLA